LIGTCNKDDFRGGRNSHDVLISVLKVLIAS
jgi:hypothetical protein